MSGLTIALAQVNPCVGDIAGNSQLVLDWARKAADAGAALVAFPEMVITGYPIEDLALRASFQRASAAAVQSIAADLVAQTVIYPALLPVGIVCAFTGVPVFLYILFRGARAHA